MRIICEFGTQRFRTMAVFLAHAGCPATLAIARESQVSLYKVRSIRLRRDISTQHVIHSMGWPFGFGGNPT